MEVTAEVHFAQLLASNQSQTRDRALKKLNKWLESKSHAEGAFTEEGMLVLWKGLYYYFWNLDKPLVQEKMAVVISEFMMKFKKAEYTFLFIDAFFQTMAREWFAVDRYRLEKFMMFTRKFLNQCFQFLKLQKWGLKAIKAFRKCLAKTVANPESQPCPLGFKLHIVDIYMDELAKVGADELKPNQTRSFLNPYCNILANCENQILLKSVQKDIFMYLLNQDVDQDRYGEFPALKFNAPSIETLLKKYMAGSLRKNNTKILANVTSRFGDYDETQECAEEVCESRKVPRPIRKRTVEKAAASLLKMDEKFAKEKLKWKKQKQI